MLYVLGTIIIMLMSRSGADVLYTVAAIMRQGR
jgi:hypothetical protein